MKRNLIILIVTLGFSQINWQYEIIDTQSSPKFNSLTVDYNNMPHVIYEKNCRRSLVYAYRDDIGWQAEIIDSVIDGFYFAFSIVCDTNNRPHICYACRHGSLDKTYICYAHRQDGKWFINTVDSISGWLGNYFWYIKSSIDLDNVGLPGLAYVAWNVADSIHYIKYAHYNGMSWDTSVVEYDSAYANLQKAPTDHSPSLRFDHNNTPHIAFYHIYQLYHSDTLKIAYYDDTLNRWIVNPVLCNIQGAWSVSLALNSQDNPYIAHTVDVGLYCTWWDGSWHPEYTGADLGWIGIRIVLDLDSYDNPHIAYLPEPLIGHPCYSYKANGIWHNCGWIEPDTFSVTGETDISFALDANNQPHVCYPIRDVCFKYAKGTITAIEEKKLVSCVKKLLFCSPSLTKDETKIQYALSKQGKFSLDLYDSSGRLVKKIFEGEKPTGIYSKKISLNGYSCGVYHLLLKTTKETVTAKIVKIN